MPGWRAVFIFFLVVWAWANPAFADKSADLKKADDLQQKVKELYLEERYADAVPSALECLSIRESHLGPEHRDTATCQIWLASLYKNLGDYADAEQLYVKALAVYEKEFGPEHQAVATCIFHLAVLYASMDDDVQAERLYKRALAIQEKVLGPEHPDIAPTMNNLAGVYKKMGDYGHAGPLYLRALAVYEKAFGPEHPETSTALNNLASLYSDAGDYAQAESLYKRALAIQEKTLGPEHPQTATTLNNLAGLYLAMADYVRAESLYKRALAIREKTIGAEHFLTGTTLGNLAGLYLTMGDYARAETMYKKALDIHEKSHGPEHPITATSLNNLAGLYVKMGDLERAEPMYARTIRIYERTLGPDHPYTATALDNLAGVYKAAGDYSKALPLIKRALDINEKALGPDHSLTADSLSNLARIYYSMGRYNRAEPLFQKALEIHERAHGAEHPTAATDLNDLALLYSSMGDDARAEPLYKRALDIREKTLGPENPFTAQSMGNLALLLAAEGKYRAAHALQIRAQKISNRMIDQVMGFTSEEQKMKFLTMQRWDLEAAVGLVAFHLAEDKTAVRNILDIWLARKGAILEAQRRYQEALAFSDDPEGLQVFRELAGVRSQLSRLMFEGPDVDKHEEYLRKVNELKLREEALEARLSKLSQTFARQKKIKRADTKQLAQELPLHSVLLDFALIQPFDYQAAGLESPWDDPRYFAFVLPAAAPDRVSLIDLGEAEPIDEAVANLKAAISDTKDLTGKKAEVAGRLLYKLVFDKLERDIGEARLIFISPDGNLSLIPFEVLLRPDGKYLIDEFSFNYLTSSRDLTGFGLLHGRAGPPLLMGDPDFRMDEAEKKQITRQLGLNENQTTSAASRSPGLRGISFTPLPGTGEEVNAIGELLGSEAEIYAGQQALEEVLTSKNISPRILHLATHGFFLTDQQVKALKGKRNIQLDDAPLPEEMRIDNPLLRSGLALAGANRGLQSRKLEGSDGLFTAEEVLGLRLHGTELVVLSACNTGVGQVRSGEGVYGLRRAFVQAGTRGLVMSMWSVPDKETKELMVQFYKNIQSGSTDRRQSLRQAALKQKEIVKARYGHTNPLFWGAFVYLGEP